MKKSKILGLIAGTFVLFFVASCGNYVSTPTADEKQAAQQEQMAQEATSSVGMPNIRNFRERKLMKDILELRDQDGLITYTYQFSEMTGKLVFFCNSIGYPIPYATQFTNPSYIAQMSATYGTATLPQQDPNGLFSPSSAEGTWIMCVDPHTKQARVVYSEPKLTVSPFPFTNETPAPKPAASPIETSPASQ